MSSYINTSADGSGFQNATASYLNLLTAASRQRSDSSEGGEDDDNTNPDDEDSNSSSEETGSKVDGNNDDDQESNEEDTYSISGSEPTSGGETVLSADRMYSALHTGAASLGFQTPFIDPVNIRSAMDSKMGMNPFLSQMPDSESRAAAAAAAAAKGYPLHERPEYGTDWNQWSYPAWFDTGGLKGPIPIERIAEMFGDFRAKFGFQRDSMLNIFDHLMTQLDSRASRMGCEMAVISLHADYIGGPNSNYKKWYFASQSDILDGIGWDAVDSHGRLNKSFKEKLANPDLEKTVDPNSEKNENEKKNFYMDFSLNSAEIRWKQIMLRMSHEERLAQVILYLLCWGEANQVRFMPECLCFIYKCSWDYWISDDLQNLEDRKDGVFLDEIITPLYKYCLEQVYEKTSEGIYAVKERDHNKIIGYDDMNQLFWFREGLLRIKTKDGTCIMDIHRNNRHLELKNVDWEKAFYKTYRENRTWWHMGVNFNRIWIIHLSTFWFYTAFNSPTLYTEGYDYMVNNQPPAHLKWSIVALGGAVGPLINLYATLGELKFLPRKYPGTRSIYKKMLFLLLTLFILVSPTCYILLFTSRDNEEKIGLLIAALQMTLAILSTLFFSFQPLAMMFGNYMSGDGNRKYLATKYFAANFHPLKSHDRLISIGLWIGIFVAKFTESYFFLTLSLRDPVRELSVVDLQTCIGDKYIGNWLCKRQTYLLLILIYVTDLILFFLDTYLWYIIFNALFSVFRSFYLGCSIWTPWKDIYSRMLKRIYHKILYTHEKHQGKYKTKHYVSQVWNSIIAGMYSEHLLPAEAVNALLFRYEFDSKGEKVLYEPHFFVSQEDTASRTVYFEPHTEAERRMSFFAQSLCTPICEPCPIESMPTFTVLIPHYGEKVMLSLREIIREEDQHSKITLLEYLKQLYPSEWEHFVRDSKGIAKSRTDTSGGHVNGNQTSKSVATILNDEEDSSSAKLNDLPFYCIGFKQSTPEFTLRTRIWASLRSQTLYRTISGFMNYARAIRLLYNVEQFSNSPNRVNLDQKAVEFELDLQSRRKFHLIAAVQRLSKFTTEENHSKELLLHAYPEMKIAYLIEEPSSIPGEDPVYYSAIIDGSCKLLQDGSRKPRFKIRLSGNPILGDGKSDNQNHAIIFYRGEYIQLVDANQDHYLEECIKIRSVLSEFEEMKAPKHPYGTPTGPPKETGARSRSEPRAPVAIIGAREYIFSENIGVLGDVAAGKEQTFGTLFARTLAKIGGKLHYGHPDFLNGIFMTTRGGVSKAQKGLHLNEDIYAGMNAVMRGGQIKHCEYMQCGKGRDLGFNSILNFTTKIGAGMGEQMLSREYFYLGTHLPLDRFLSFYYAHPGFHINNMFISISLNLFLYVCLNLSVLIRESIICDYDRHAPITNLHRPLGCNNLIPVLEWLERCVLSIFVVFFMSFFPLFVQEMTERGIWRSITRLSRHFASLSPLFEVFVCQIYAQSLVHDLAIGGARYISTGRGFATTRVPFSALYMRFAKQSLYFGAISLLVLTFTSLVMWRACLLWFWITSFALTFAPFLYNPHQFSFCEFFLDYREYLKWLCRGNTNWKANSWISYTRKIRTSVIGYKKVTLGDPSEQDSKGVKRPRFFNVFVSEVIGPLLSMVFTVVPYLFSNAQNDIRGVRATNSLLRLGLCAFGPVAVNAVVLLIQVIMSCSICQLFVLCSKKSPGKIAGITHFVSLFVHLIFFNVMLFTENWDFSRALLGIIACMNIQLFFFKVLEVLFLTRELPHDHTNRVWWSGKWFTAKLGWRTLTQPCREFFCKLIECSYFAMDCTLGHFILFIQIPIIIFPYIDRWHTLMLFWLLPSQQIRRPIFSTKQKKLRKRTVWKYAFLYITVLFLYLVLLIGPFIAHKFIPVDFEKMCNSIIPGIVQPQPPEYTSLGVKHVN